MNHLPLIIKREYITKVKNKSFIIMTFLSPLIFITLIALVTYLSKMNKEKVRAITVLDETGQIDVIFKNTEKTAYNILKNKSLDDAKKVSNKSGAYGLLHIKNGDNMEAISEGIKFYSEESPSITLIADLEDNLQKKLTSLNLKKNGVDIHIIKASQIRVNIAQESFEGKTTSKADPIIKLIFGGAAGYLLFMFIIIYGNMIMRSVIEEKTSRIIEVIISSVKPIQLMLGKIIGTTLAGITQFAIWLLLGTVLMSVLSLIVDIDFTQMQTPQQELIQQAMEEPELNMYINHAVNAFYNLPIFNLIVAFILFFVGGYLLYSSLYAAIGAAVDNETDTQQFMFPILMPLILAVYIGFFIVIENPHGTVSTVFSFIPLTSPVVMLMRIPFGVPFWQQLLSISLLVITFMLFVWFAAKIYRVGILMYGKKTSYKELIKWIKY